MRVFQFHSEATIGDAVTESLFYAQSILEAYSIPSRIYAEHRDPRLADKVGLIGQINPRATDLLIIHHSTGHDIMPYLKSLNCRKILVYHGSTLPTRVGQLPDFQRSAQIGLAQLSELRTMVQGVMANSDFNAIELKRRGFEDVTTIPLLQNFKALLDHPHDPRPYYFDEPRYQLLCVGHLHPDKGQMYLVRFMERYCDAFDHPLHLTLVAPPDHAEDHARRLLDLIKHSNLVDRIKVAENVSDTELYGHYRAADAYVSYGEDFSTPLIESMVFDVPVIAYNSRAVAGIPGDGGEWLSTLKPEELAGTLSDLFYKPEKRREIIKRQRRKLQEFDREQVSERFLEFLKPHLPSDISPRRSALPIRTAKSNVKRHYTIEGACETSYSLAVVNRSLGLALAARETAGVALEPAEGVPGYKLDPAGLREHPEIVPLLKSRSSTYGATRISIRNMFPLRPAGMMGDFRISTLAWEESELPRTSVRLMNRYLDGLVVPTTFVRTVCRNSGVRVPIDVYGHGLDHLGEPLPAEGKKTKDRPFVFGHISSGLARKGVEELLSAYSMAFHRRDNVELVIKTYENTTNIVQALYDQLFAGRPQAPVVRIIYNDLTDEDMRLFYASVDTMVLPTRGEGFNLPAAEAMKFGVPVITTAYSGQLDFCDDSNCVLIGYDFEKSASHLGTTHAMWVRPRVDELVSALRRAHSHEGRTTMRKKAANAKATTHGMIWEKSAEKVEQFVDSLVRQRPEKKRLKLAWVSTWNARCGIATYSEFLIDNLPPGWFDVTIMANELEKVGRDGPNVMRTWSSHKSLDGTVAEIIQGGHDAAVFQFNFGLLTLADLADAIVELNAANIDTYVFLHKTQDEVTPDGILSIKGVAEGLRLATRLLVHSVEDVNRLKSYGLVDNVIKLPHGAFYPEPLDRHSVRRLLGLHRFGPVIACYGFLMPHKGVQELILAFNALTGKYPDAALLLVNAAHSEQQSGPEKTQCLALIENLDLGARVSLITEFLSNEQSMLLLQASDIIVYPYQHTGESASGAVRYGLSSLRPILTTPLPIFDDVTEMTARAEGVRPLQIAQALQKLLEDPGEQQRLVALEQAWLDEHSWKVVAERFANIVIGLYGDRHDFSVMRDNLKVVSPEPTAKNAIEITVNDESWFNDLADEAFIRMSYQRVLGRDADPLGLNHYKHALGTGIIARREMIKDIEESDEGRMHKAGKDIEESDEGLTHKAGKDIEESDEGLTHRAGASTWVPVRFSDLDVVDDEAFVARVYKKLLNRHPDAEDIRTMLELLSKGSHTREDVVRVALASDEFVNNNLPIRVVYDEPVLLTGESKSEDIGKGPISAEAQ
jgi:glycosyltransferase involved in cell wall biosynthesis